MKFPFKHTKEPWGTLSAEAFWDRRVSLSDWRDGFLTGHGAYVPQTLRHIPPQRGIGFLGMSAFVKAWPEIRASIIERWPELRKKINTWDVYWSLCATGTPDIRPLEAWKTLPRRRREFLLHVAIHQGANIYAVSKSLHITYRRGHEHAKKLVSMGFLKRVDTFERGRRKALLYATQEPVVTVIHSSDSDEVFAK